MVAGEGREGESKREEDKLAGVEEDEDGGADPRTRPWPLKVEGEEEKGRLTFLMMPFIFPLTSSIRERSKLKKEETLLNPQRIKNLNLMQGLSKKIKFWRRNR